LKKHGWLLCEESIKRKKERKKKEGRKKEGRRQEGEKEGEKVYMLENIIIVARQFSDFS
jgi:hypothetical protein